MKRNQITIVNEQDRLEVAKILVKNGYTARQAKIKATPTGKTIRTVAEYWREEE